MLKRLCLIVAVCALPLTAQASPELAKVWGQQAAALSNETGELITAIDKDEPAIASDDYFVRLDKFARTSAQLGKWIDATDGPHDLGCIFRGMHVEANTQGEALDVADTAEMRRAAMTRLATMFSDAEMISAAASQRTATPTLDTRHSTEGCPMEAEAARAALR